MQRRFGSIQRIEIMDPCAQTGMIGLGQQIPVELDAVIPLTLCPNSDPMKSSFLPG